jgi:hypothetical protein
MAELPAPANGVFKKKIDAAVLKSLPTMKS